MTIEATLEQFITSHSYPVLFATISGAHLYGFPSEDSDYDLRGVHILPLSDVIGLNSLQETVDQTVVQDGLELDLVTHEVKKFMNLMLKKNGYVLEQLWSPLVVQTSPEHEELKEIGAKCVTRFHAYHYLGFAQTQWKLFQKDNPPRVKPLLYVFRVLLTGIHLMKTGTIEANLRTLNEEAQLSWIPDLIDRKIQGRETERLEQTESEFYHHEYERLSEQLKEEMSSSHLPESSSAKPLLHDLLIRIRLQLQQ